MDATTSAVVVNATNATNDDDPQWIGAIESTAVILVGIIALFFGSLVCATIYLRPRLRTVTNLLIVNLAIADICVAVVSVPFVAASLAVRRWIFGDAWCRAAGFLSVLFSGASIVTLAAISVERYYSTSHPRARQRSYRRAALMIAFVWLHATIFSFPPLVGLGSFDFNDGKNRCAVAWAKRGADQWYNTALVIGLFIIPLLVMTFAYIGIFWRMDKRAKRLKQNAENGGAATGDYPDSPSASRGRTPEPCRRRGSTPSLCWIGSVQGHSTSRYRRSVRQLALERRLAKTVLTVIGVFLLCWFPYYSVNLWSAFTGRDVSPTVDYVTYLLALINSACNPMIYGLRNKKFRETFKAILTCRRVSYSERRYSLSRSVSQSLPAVVAIGCEGLKLPAKRRNSQDSGFMQLIHLDCRRRSSPPQPRPPPPNNKFSSSSGSVEDSGTPSSDLSATAVPREKADPDTSPPPQKRPRMCEEEPRRVCAERRRAGSGRRRAPPPPPPPRPPPPPAFKLNAPWTGAYKFDESSVGNSVVETINIVFRDESLV